MPQRILVCGGAGHIGSHMVRLLRAEGHDVTVFDNFAQGHRAALPAGVAVIEGDLNDRAALSRAFSGRGFDAVHHLAALISVAESLAAPELCDPANMVGTRNLLDAMRRAGCERIVFFSTAAIFGNPETDRIAGDHRRAPLNPCGRSKLMMEEILADHARAHGIRSVSFRYFDIPVSMAPRRQGDSAMQDADSSRARERLSWKPEMPGIERIIATAWASHGSPSCGPFAANPGERESL